MSLEVLPIITKPMRITHSTSTLIDNIYLPKNLTRDVQSSILVEDISDQLPCIACINRGGRIYTNNLTLETRTLDKNSIDNVRMDLNQINWHQLFGSDLCVKKIKQEPCITFIILKSSKWLCKMYKNTLSDNANETPQKTNKKNNAVYSIN